MRTVSTRAAAIHIGFRRRRDFYTAYFSIVYFFKWCQKVFMAFESWSRYVMRRNHTHGVMFYAQQKYLRRIIIEMEPIENETKLVWHSIRFRQSHSVIDVPFFFFGFDYIVRLNRSYILITGIFSHKLFSYYFAFTFARVTQHRSILTMNELKQKIWFSYHNSSLFEF